MTTTVPAAQGTASDQTPRRGRRARTDVAVVMAVVSIVSVLIVGVFNLATARDFLSSAIEQQLLSVGESRMERLERGVESLGDIVVSVASGTGVAQAVEDLTAGYGEIDEPLSDAQVEALRGVYAAGLADIVPPG